MQVPTTLLAQVDSSVGGKVGVNLKAGKNLVGAFYQPQAGAVRFGHAQNFARPRISRRPRRGHQIRHHLRCEVVRADRTPSAKNAETRTKRHSRRSIARCCEIKAEVVGQDETESGLRAILNFGHTIGHAIENISGYGKFLHGEAISIGQVAAAKLSREILGLPERDVERIENIFAARRPAGANQIERRRSVKNCSTPCASTKRSAAAKSNLSWPAKIGMVEFGQTVAPGVIDEGAGLIHQAFGGAKS